MNDVDKDLVSLSMCITAAYGDDPPPVLALRQSLVTLPSGEKTWSRLEVEVQRGPFRLTSEMYRCLREDGERTPQQEHICLRHHPVLDDKELAAMVAMCAWKNDNIERNPAIWAWFQPRRVQWCQGRVSSLEYSWTQLFGWWAKWGLQWPTRSLIEAGGEGSSAVQ